MSPNAIVLAKPDSTEEQNDALQLLAHERSKLREHMGLSTHEGGEVPDVEMKHCLSEIQALIKVNDEIFARCMVNSRAETGDKTTLERFGFEKIEVRMEVNKITMVTQAERAQNLFDTSSLSKLPTCLADTLFVKYKSPPFSAYIDYEDYFKKVRMLLHDDALQLLLPKLKDHLESVQICLGEIDEWAMQSHKTLSFVNRLSKEKMCQIPNYIFPFQELPICLSCGNEINLGSPCTNEKCGYTRILVQFRNSTLDLSNEGHCDRLMKFISSIGGV